MLPEYANCDDGYAWTAPVGSFKPNPWRLYDMLGNVENWVEDCYTDNYRKAPGDGSAYIKEGCTERMAAFNPGCRSSFLFGQAIRAGDR
jgi:formylglycine-generating enzyme required for sulfatase activity